MSKTILSLFDHSGNWSAPYRKAGYNVIQVDLQNDGTDARLLQRQVAKSLDRHSILPDQVYGILSAPPCQVFAGSGARWPRTNEDMIDGLSMVDAVMRYVVTLQPKFWVLENPIGKLVRYLGKPAFYFNPCDFGDPYTKRTCLWGNFNIPKFNRVEPEEGSKMHLLPPSDDRVNLRSATPKGFAKAFYEANK